MITSSKTIPNYCCINWKSQDTHILQGLRTLFEPNGFLLTDVTLACDGEYIKAHKLVLSLCSKFFRDLFQKNRADVSNTIVILSNISAPNLRHLLRFMYEGKVHIPKKQIDNFLKAGRLLKIEGLEGITNHNEDDDSEEAEHASKSRSNFRTHLSSARKVVPSSSRSLSSTVSVKRAHVEAHVHARNQGNPVDPLREVLQTDEVNEERTEMADPILIKSERVDRERSDSDMDAYHEEEFIEDISGERVEEENAQLAKKSSFSFQTAAVGPQRTKRRKLTSVVWKYFTRDASTSIATCKLCTEEEGIVSLKISQGSTTGLMRHLMSAHPGAVRKPKISYLSKMPSNEDLRDLSDEDDEKNVNSAIITSAPIARTDGSKFRRILGRRKRKSAVWLFFKPDASFSSATCKLCKEDPTTIKTPRGCTSGLARHLLSLHPGKLERYQRGDLNYSAVSPTDEASERDNNHEDESASSNDIPNPTKEDTDTVNKT